MRTCNEKQISLAQRSRDFYVLLLFGKKKNNFRIVRVVKNRVAGNRV